MMVQIVDFTYATPACFDHITELLVRTVRVVVGIALLPVRGGSLLAIIPPGWLVFLFQGLPVLRSVSQILQPRKILKTHIEFDGEPGSFRGLIESALREMVDVQAALNVTLDAPEVVGQDRFQETIVCIVNQHGCVELQLPWCHVIEHVDLALGGVLAAGKYRPGSNHIPKSASSPG